MKPTININIDRITDSIEVTGKKGKISKKFTEKVFCKLNKIINSHSFVFPATESIDPRNSNESLQAKTNFFEAAHQLEEYLIRNENLKDVEIPLTALFVMKESFLETTRTNEHHQSGCNLTYKAWKSSRSGRQSSDDGYNF
ncbi:hypothetical protein [Flavobacterium geliluteum]|uniref:Uncharacterized protein n=1 Tax=Flavobacterium geliluteum TaxID=2816120 RepID=A0A941AWH4_9FLAO|nr:hypothetical protein [Flavobacterium geliluteum]MBP4139989.1 hypothetical protein [Flavobacterium geliluteum]